MGKRSSKFPRIENEAYYTPHAAVLPLIPHLRRERIRTFAEPCCGDGGLVRSLEAFGLRCTYQGDITTGQDALALASYGEVDAIVTNPPYDKPRTLMHALIAHFTKAGPAWLLLEADWAQTARAKPYLAFCSDLVAVGRMKWLGEHTPSAGFDNFSWCRFDPDHDGAPPRLHPRARPVRIKGGHTCLECTTVFRPLRSDTHYCSNACRQGRGAAGAIRNAGGLVRYG